MKVVKNLTFAEEENSSTTEDTKAESFSQALIQKQEASAEKDRGNEHFKVRLLLCCNDDGHCQMILRAALPHPHL